MQPCVWPITDLVPHRQPMLLLDAVVSFDANRLRATLTIRDDSSFLEAQGVPGHIALEYMAQACAAFAGTDARSKGGAPRIGFLLGTRRCVFHRPWFLLGETLTVEVTLLYRDTALGSFTGCIEIAGEIVAEAELTVYEPPGNAILPA